jgi:hypothetical protein
VQSEIFDEEKSRITWVKLEGGMEGDFLVTVVSPEGRCFAKSPKIPRIDSLYINADKILYHAVRLSSLLMVYPLRVV